MRDVSTQKWILIVAERLLVGIDIQGKDNFYLIIFT